MKELTNEELEYFNNQLAKRFMTDIEGFYISAPFMDIPIGVRLIPLPSAEDVNNVNESEIKDNEIYFYTTSLKQAVYHLLRHLRIIKEESNVMKDKDDNSIILKTYILHVYQCVAMLQLINGMDL